MRETTATDSRETTRAFLTEHRDLRSAALADHLVATIETDHPAYLQGVVVSHADLVHSCRTNVRAILDLMLGALAGDGPRPEDAPESVFAPARSTGALRAEQGMPLDDVLRSFRIGGRLIWDDLITAGEGRIDNAGLREVGTLLWEAVDATSAHVAAAYHLGERARVRSDEQRRATLWESLLNGGARDPGFALEAAALLDLPPVGDLVVVVARGLDGTTCERVLAPHATAFTRHADDLVGVVALRDDTPAAIHEALVRLAAGPDGPRVAVSAVIAGLAAVDDGHLQARLALRTTAATGLVRYDDVLPEALLLSVPDVAERLLARWVTPLTDLGEEGVLLLDTLVAWVGAGGSATRAAPLVPCHRNTVLNRLHRVAQVTGVPLDDDAPPADLDLALRARALRQARAGR